MAVDERLELRKRFPQKVFCPLCTCTASVTLLAWTSTDMFRWSQSSQIPACMWNYKSEIACLPTLFVIRDLHYSFSVSLQAVLIETTLFMTFFDRKVWTFLITAQRKLLKNRAYKTQVLNQRALRHSIHRSVSLEANQYKLSLEKSCSLPVSRYRRPVENKDFV